MADFSKQANVNKLVSKTFLPFGNWAALSGAWSEQFDDATNLPRLRRTADAGVTEVLLSCDLDSRSRSNVGQRLASVELNYEVDTADLEDVTLTVIRYTPGADNAAASSAALAGSWDAAHDTAGERGDDTAAPELHTAVFTLDNAVHLDNDEAVMLRVAVDGDAGAAGIFDLRSWILHFEQERGDA